MVKELLNSGDVKMKTALHKEPLFLIIDDEKIICDSCRAVLSHNGYTAAMAMDGETGLKKVRELTPDVVLLDLKMPGMSGMEVLREIQAFNPTIITVIITGYATIESAVESMKLGSFDYLPKPFSPAELRAVVQRALERRKLVLETESLRKEKAAMQGKFISMVSHQLRTPLVAVQEYLEVILGGMAGEVAVQQKEMMQRIQIRIDELLSLISDWLSFARLDKSVVSELFEPVDIVILVQEIVAFMQPVAREKGLTCEIAPSGTLTVKGHKASLRELFSNLISNGLNYNRPQGKVTIAFSEADDSIVVEVADTGIGISESEIPFIFDEFYRAKNKEVQGIRGTGLGLSIAKRVVEAHKGNLTVRSKVGAGTTFTVSLPKGGASESTKNLINRG